MTDSLSFTWSDALREFLLYKQASFAPKTVRYYRVQLGHLLLWTEQEIIPLDEARHEINVRKKADSLFQRGYSGRWLTEDVLEVVSPQDAVYVLDLAGLPKQISLHSLRRFSLNRLAKHNLLAAQQIAGHKSLETTLIYTKLDADFVRGAHEEAGVLRGVVQSRRPMRRAARRHLV